MQIYHGGKFLFYFLFFCVYFCFDLYWFFFVLCILSLWALDGTESTGDGRTYGTEETFGVLNVTWNGFASQQMVDNLKAIVNATQGPTN